MPRLPRIRWAALVPVRWSWLRLLAMPSSYVLVVALIVTIIAKAKVLRGIEEVEFWPGRLIAAAAPDAAIFLGLAALLAIAERAWRRARFATLPLAILVTTLASINAVQLWITGEQLTAQVLVLGLERFTDVRAMARASLDPGVGVVALVACGIALPVTAALVLRRRDLAISPSADGNERARAAGGVTLFALVLIAVSPVPDQFAGLYRNAVAHTAWGLAKGERGWNGGLGLFTGYKPHDLVEPAAIDRLRTGPRPNIVVIILESARRDATSLAGPAAPARMPHLEQLAARGLEITHGRAVIPHTTKSMWSMFCGRLPILQPKLYETTSASDVQCIPHILAAAGWRTGFLQSAIGRFEDRPRLVHRLGFREFVAAEQYTTTLGGYLSTDDEPLVQQLEKWLDKSNAAPFMVTMLTSSTHHPYILSDASAERAKANGRPSSSDRERYDRQLEAQDVMIGGVLDLLRRRGVLDNTIVVALGDHGEGFGEKAARQHALNFYEEGLRVPWVIAGPGVAHQRIDANASVLDLAPTLLDLLGLELSADAAAATHARSVLRISGDRVLPFSCFFDKTCYGFVVASMKVVSMRETGRAFAFDLAADPDERSPIALSSELETILARVQRTVDQHRTNSRPVRRDPMLEFWPWNCPPDQPCGIKQ